MRAALTAVSTASAPVFIGSALAIPVASQTARRNGPSWSLWKARLVTASRAACSPRTRDERRMAVAEAHRGIRRHHVEVAAAVAVEQPDAGAALQRHRERVVVGGAVAALEVGGRRVARQGGAGAAFRVVVIVGSGSDSRQCAAMKAKCAFGLLRQFSLLDAITVHPMI